MTKQSKLSHLYQTYTCSICKRKLSGVKIIDTSTKKTLQKLICPKHGAVQPLAGLYSNNKPS